MAKIECNCKFTLLSNHYYVNGVGTIPMCALWPELHIILEPNMFQDRIKIAWDAYILPMNIVDKLRSEDVIVTNNMGMLFSKGSYVTTDVKCTHPEMSMADVLR